MPLRNVLRLSHKSLYLHFPSRCPILATCHRSHPPPLLTLLRLSSSSQHTGEAPCVPPADHCWLYCWPAALSSFLLGPRGGERRRRGLQGLPGHVFAEPPGHPHPYRGAHARTHGRASSFSIEDLCKNLTGSYPTFLPGGRNLTRTRVRAPAHPPTRTGMGGIPRKT